MNNPKMTLKQRQMIATVARMQEYMATYTQQIGYSDYSTSTFIDDVLYGLGLALDPEGNKYGRGFDAFKATLRKHLEA